MVPQSCDWELLPWQFFDFELQERVRVCNPPPQVWLQVLQAPHCDQVPLPDIEMKNETELMRKAGN